MRTTISAEYLEGNIHRDLERGKLHALEGTLQRIDYLTQELRVVALDQVWHFTLDPECQLWFDDKPAILRCFQPLDHVNIIYAAGETKQVIKAMYAWEKPLA